MGGARVWAAAAGSLLPGKGGSQRPGKAKPGGTKEKPRVNRWSATAPRQAESGAGGNRSQSYPRAKAELPGKAEACFLKITCSKFL